MKLEDFPLRSQYTTETGKIVMCDRLYVCVMNGKERVGRFRERFPGWRREIHGEEPDAVFLSMYLEDCEDWLSIVLPVEQVIREATDADIAAFGVPVL